MSAPAYEVAVRLEVCRCGAFGAPHGYLFVDCNYCPTGPAAFSIQVMLVNLSIFFDWALERDIEVAPQPETILCAVQHLSLPVESDKDKEVYEALRENGGSTESFVCERASTIALAFHKPTTMRMVS